MNFRKVVNRWPCCANCKHMNRKYDWLRSTTRRWILVSLITCDAEVEGCDFMEGDAVLAAYYICDLYEERE